MNIGGKSHEQVSVLASASPGVLPRNAQETKRHPSQGVLNSLQTACSDDFQGQIREVEQELHHGQNHGFTPCCPTQVVLLGAGS
ncbi:hypothetical protein AM1_D0116 (plasmid) [Acaryochloris marina MBIC11017]|uniref:Uncharacterized protein n=1 Tax=Acaryochloris marina (strain MBIC 11017) TaxID=329726 RepID=A8ZNM5_ACAM1|nr:hypothetical protein AM1_D0116 [Acaryochloris marina MBIC11017]